MNNKLFIVINRLINNCNLWQQEPLDVTKSELILISLIVSLGLILITFVLLLA